MARRFFSYSTKRDSVQRYLDGESVSSIAKELGASREGVYQWIRAAGIDPARVDLMRRRASHSELELRKTFTPQKWIALGRPRCAICQTPLRRQGRTCGGECYSLWVIARLYLTPDARQRQRVFQARSNIRRGTQLIYSQHVLDGSLVLPPPNPHSPRVLDALERIKVLSREGSQVWAEYDLSPPASSLPLDITNETD